MKLYSQDQLIVTWSLVAIIQTNSNGPRVYTHVTRMWWILKWNVFTFICVSLPYKNGSSQEFDGHKNVKYFNFNGEVISNSINS